MYDKNKIIEAIWQDPEKCTGLHWERNGNQWQTSCRYDGTISHRRRDKTVLNLAEDGHTIFVNYHGSQFASTDIFGLMQIILSTNDRGDVWRFLGETYGIPAEYAYKSEQERERAEARRAQAGIIQDIAAFLLKEIDTESGKPARDYLESRGLKSSPRIGAYGREIRHRLLQELKKKYRETMSDTDIENAVYNNLPTGDADDYRVVLPYYNGSRVTGFCLRKTSGKEDLHKYLYSKTYEKGGTFAKGGYCFNLKASQPVILVEGLLDAEAIRQAAEAGGEEFAAMQNILAVGGLQLNEDDYDEAKNQVATLKRFKAKHLIFIPDFENEKNSNEIRSRGANRTIECVLPHIKQDGTEDGFLSLKIAELVNADGCKDSDEFIRRFGIAEFKRAIDSALPWYKWALKNAVRQHRDDTDALADAAVGIYKKIESYAAREMLRQEFAAAEKEPYIKQLAEAGITAAVLRHIDENGEASTWRSRMTALVGELNGAMEKKATATEVGRILRDAQRTQNLQAGSLFSAQINATADTLHALVKSRPEPLQTKWNMFSHKKDGTVGIVRKISFSPAAVSIVAAPTNHGKTLFLLQTCLHLARESRKRFIYISTENDAEQLYIRALAAYIGKGWKEKPLKDRKETPRAILRKYIKLADVPSELFCHADDELPEAVRKFLDKKTREYWREVAPYLSLLRIGTDTETICTNVTAQVEAWKDAGVEVGGIFIDYIQQLRVNGRAYSRTDEMQAVCNLLNDTAKACAVPVIAAAQLNRDATKANGVRFDGVELANIGESSGIENIAEDVYMLWQTNKINPEEFVTGKGFKLKNSQYRTRRCFDSDKDPNSRRDGYLYVENLKARDYSGGSYCLLPYEGGAGYIEHDKETAQFTPYRQNND